jgi:uncharacterized glyoxalase superfamily protein PhnB
LAETSWARAYGELIDQFGVSWTIDCAKAKTELEIEREVA